MEEQVPSCHGGNKLSQELSNVSILIKNRLNSVFEFSYAAVTIHCDYVTSRSFYSEISLTSSLNPVSYWEICASPMNQISTTPSELGPNALKWYP